MKKVLLISAMIITQLCMAQNDKNRGYKVRVGEQAPHFSFSLMDGTPISNESVKGKVVVIQFTASWCSVCRKEMPHLEREVWQRFKNEDFMLIGIDLKEEEEKVKLFIENMGVTYPMAIDTDGSLFELFTLPKAGVTRNIVIDREGKIIFLTRLYERKEFKQMVKIIDKELEKVN